MLTLQDISPQHVEKVFTQDYTPQTHIEGVKIIDVKSFAAEEGDFSELLRLDEKGHLEILPDFQLRQINRTYLFPGSIKGWHMHMKQNELWYVPPTSHIVAGLWDLRKGSPTENATMKIVLGGNQSRMLLIPSGVAHGSVNHSNKGLNLYYFVNQKFDLHDPDEKRVHWDALGADFWLPERD